MDSDDVHQDHSKRPMSTGRIRPVQRDQYQLNAADHRELPNKVETVDAVVRERALSAGRSRSRTGNRTPNGNDVLRGDNATGRTGKQMSNHQQVKNALSNVCLGGVHFAGMREEALNVIDKYLAGELGFDQVIMLNS